MRFGLIKWAGLVWLALYLNILLCPSELAIISSSLITCVAQKLLPSVTGYHPRDTPPDLAQELLLLNIPSPKPGAHLFFAKPDHFHTRRTEAVFPLPLPGIWGVSVSLCLMSQTCSPVPLRKIIMLHGEILPPWMSLLRP